MKLRYSDILMKQPKSKETKSGDEIVTDIVTRAGLEIA